MARIRKERRAGWARPANIRAPFSGLCKYFFVFPLLETTRTFGFCGCVDAYRSGIRLGKTVSSHCWQSPLGLHVAG